MLPVDTSRIDNGATYLAWNVSLCRHNLSVTYEQAELCKNSTSHILIKIIFSCFCYTKRIFLSFNCAGYGDRGAPPKIPGELTACGQQRQCWVRASHVHQRYWCQPLKLWNLERLDFEVWHKSHPSRLLYRFVHGNSASLSSQPASC